MRFFTLIFIVLSFSSVNAQLSTALKDKLIRGSNELYGSYCGIAGQHPPNRVTIEKWIVKEQVSSILDWLHSPNRVRQVYAAEALIRLYNRRVIDELEIDDLSFISKLKASNESIPICSGCVYSEETVKKILAEWKFE